MSCIYRVPEAGLIVSMKHVRSADDVPACKHCECQLETVSCNSPLLLLLLLLLLLHQVPSELPQTAKLMPQLSSTFESGSRQPYTLCIARGRTARAAFNVTGARGSGRRGARVTLNSGEPSTNSVVLQSETVGLKSGQKCYAQVWARSGNKGSRLTTRLFRASAAGTTSGGRLAVFRADQHRSDGSIAGEKESRLQRGSYCLHVLGPVDIKTSTDYAVQLDFGLVQSGSSVDIDDVEVYCV
jgi:hypothetical protein